MHCKLDECVPVEVLAVLERHGWEGSTVSSQGLKGARDRQVLAHCHERGFVLFTLDMDFARRAAAPAASHCGIVVLRPARPGRGAAQDLLVKALPALAHARIQDRVVIVEEGALHLRP